jgi:NAD+ synthase
MKETDYKSVLEVLVLFIQEFLQKNGFSKSVLGVSGGLDSAVVLSLLVRSIGADNVFALLMPYRISSSRNQDDAEKLCHSLGVSFELIDISPFIDPYFHKYPTDNRILIGNKCARERMSILYDFSMRKKALVAGTSNKSEMLIGYTTLYGDSAAAFLPIGDLYKTQVQDLARFLQIPDNIIQKPPSADLWRNQTDEGEIGLTYALLDEILFLLVDKRFPPSKIIEKGYRQEDVEQVKKLIITSQYKRTLPPIPKLSGRTVGMDFRYLRDWNR